MAERRMFAKTIIDSDAFLDMPITARLLYYDLSMRADDDGFVNSPKKIMRMVGASNDDLVILASKKFIIPFDSGVVVIKHWKIHNYIQSDRYKPTEYTEEKAMLSVKENKAYTLNTEGFEVVDTECIQDVSDMDTQVRLGKDRLGKESIGKDSIGESKKAKRFVAPNIDEIKDYCVEKNYPVKSAEAFFNYYDSKGWMVGKNKMVNWHSALAGWISREKDFNPQRKEKVDSDFDIDSWLHE